MIYFVLFSATIFCIYAGGRSRGVLSVLFVVVGLALPCFFAAFRDETVGVDVLSYAKWMCNSAQILPFTEFMAAYSDIAAPGWNLMTWLSVRLLNGMVGYQFVIEALCVVPVYLAARRLFPRQEWTVVLPWLLTCFSFSMNGMRQSVAMGFVLYSVTFVIERRPVSFCVCIGFAALFHQTAPVASVLYPLALLVVYGKTVRMLFGKWRGVVLLFFFAGVFSGIFALGPSWVIALSSLKSSYAYQVAHIGEGDVSISGAYLFLVVLVTMALFKNERAAVVARTREPASSQSNAAEYEGSPASSVLSDRVILLGVAASIGYLFLQLNYIASSVGRIGYYGSIILVLLAGEIYREGSRGRSTYKFLMVALMTYFIVCILLLGQEAVYPYTSSILDIR